MESAKRDAGEQNWGMGQPYLVHVPDPAYKTTCLVSLSQSVCMMG